MDGHCILLAEKVSEISNSVLWVANKLSLGLGALELLALNVGQDGRDLTVTLLVGNDLCLAVAGCVGDAAVRVAECDTNGHLGRCLSVCAHGVEV